MRQLQAKYKTKYKKCLTVNKKYKIIDSGEPGWPGPPSPWPVNKIINKNNINLHHHPDCPPQNGGPYSSCSSPGQRGAGWVGPAVWGPRWWDYMMMMIMMMMMIFILINNFINRPGGGGPGHPGSPESMSLYFLLTVTHFLYFVLYFACNCRTFI